MILNNITLKNFKSYESATINFNKGITLILGRNGAGKSTLLEAISYALFKNANGKINDLVRKPQSSNEKINYMEVTLDFTHNGREYQVKRAKKPSKNTAELRFKENDKFQIKAAGDKNVTSEIETILEIDSKSFLNAIYIRQGEITDLIDKTPGERKEFISKLLNIDTLEKAWTQIKEIIRVYESQKDENNGKLSKYNQIREDNETIKETINTTKEELEKLNNKKESIKNEIGQLNDELEKAVEIKDKYDKLNTELMLENKELKDLKDQEIRLSKKLEDMAHNETEIKKLEKEIKILPKLKEVLELKQEINSCTKELNNKKDVISDIEKNTTDLKNTKHNYEEYKKLNENKVNFTKQLDDLNAGLNKLNEINYKRKSLEDQKEKAFKKFKKIVDMANELFNEDFRKMDIIKQRVNDEITKNEDFIKELEIKSSENEKIISSKEATLKSTQEALEELEHSEGTCPVCQSEITSQKHGELKIKYENIIIQCEGMIEEKTIGNENHKEKLIQLRDKLEQVKNISIPQLEEDYAEYANLRNQLYKLEKVDDDLAKTNKQIKNLRDEEKKQDELISKLEKDYNKYMYASKRISDLPSITQTTKEYEDIQKQITDNKNKIKEISKTVPLQDNIERKVKYLEDKQMEYNRLCGLVSNKEETLADKEKCTTKIKTQTHKITNITKEIAQLSYDPDKHEKINTAYTSTEEKMKETELNIVQKETELKNNETQQKKNIGELKQLDEIKQEQQYIEDYIKILNEIRYSYSKDGVQKDLRKAVKPQIEKNTSEIFNEFDFKYRGINIDEDYNLTVQSKVEDISLDMLSGGEKIVIALALRLGIAKAVTKNKTEVLILDEPTIHLDAERRSYLIEIIRKINIVPQMLVVTHDEGMESLSNNIIKIDKIDGISTYANI